MNIDFNEKELNILLNALENLEMDLEFRIDDIREVLNDTNSKIIGDRTYNYKELNSSLNRIKKIKALENKIMNI